MRATGVVTAALAMVAAIADASLAECPASCISRAWTQTHCNASSAMDTTSNANGCTDRIAYDLAAGTALLEHWGGFSTCGESVSLEDPFVLSDPSGGPAMVEFVLSIDYYVGGIAGAEATLEVNGGSPATWTLELMPGDPIADSETQLVVQAEMYTGVPLVVRYWS